LSICKMHIPASLFGVDCTGRTQRIPGTFCID
jgi:hypothetical protein